MFPNLLGCFGGNALACDPTLVLVIFVGIVAIAAFVGLIISVVALYDANHNGRR